MKKSKKWIPAVALTVALTLGVLWFLQALLMPKYMSDIVEGVFTEEYYNETTNHEVLFVGDCEAYENFSPITLYEDYGITSYIRGSAQQLTWQSYYLLEDALRIETPKVVVFNVLEMKYNEPQSEAYNRMTLDGFKPTLTKLNAIKASMTEQEKLIDYVFPILRYHSRWSELSGEDFKYLFKRDKISHNGYYMRVDVRPVKEFPEPDVLADYTLGSYAMGYLDKMRSLCREKGIELVLMKSPSLFPHWYKEWDEQLVAYAEKHGLAYLNYADMAEEIGIDYQTDTYDGGLHMNLSGAEKASRHFGKFLKDNYELTDYRQVPEYKAVYEEKIRFYYDMKQAQLKELEELGEIRSF